MHFLRGYVSIAAALLLCAGVALADPSSPPEKAWSIDEIPALAGASGTQTENEPGNNTCPGDPYTLGVTYIAEIGPTTADEDWICFQCNAGDFITVATDSGGASEIGDTILELYADDCVTLLTSDDDGGPGFYSLISGFVAPYTGNYYARALPWIPSPSTGSYIMIADCQPPPMPGFCPIGQYKAVKIDVNQPIPDDDPNGFELPRIKFNPQPGFVVTDVVIDLEIEHTWVGDLIITLKKYDALDNLVASVDLVNRPGVPEVSTVGCSGDLIGDPENKYYFGSDPALPALGENEYCLESITAGCYGVAPENVAGLEVFNNLPKGEGTWALCISDNAFLDTGYVYNWSVHLLCDAPVSVEEENWGAVKAGYRK